MSNIFEDYATIEAILNRPDTKVREVEGRRLFIVGHKSFLAIVDILLRLQATDALEGDPRISAMGYNNVSLAVSVKDTHHYFVCEEAEPVLDKLYESKTKEAVKA